MLGRVAFLIVLSVTLGSCSRLIEVRAAFKDGKLVFTGDDDRETFYPWCLGNFAVAGSDGVDAWRFEVPLEIRQGKTKCGPNLPITYGEAQRDAKIITPPQPLENGKLYLITGDGGGLYDGAFRYEKQTIVRRRITNVTPDVGVRNRALGYEKTFVADDNGTISGATDSPRHRPASSAPRPVNP